MTAPTWRMGTHEAARLTPGEQVALELIGQLPLATISHLLPLGIGRSRSALCSDVARLVERGLVAAFDGPPHGACRRRRLLLLTNLGLAVLACRYGADPRELAHSLALGRSPLEALIRQLPAVLSSYELLALLARVHGGKARLRAWRCPWRGPGWTACGAAASSHGMCLPAYAALACGRDNGQQPVVSGYVMVADTGGLSPLALRPQLARLAHLQFSTGTSAPVVAIATTSDRRVEAWAAVLDRIAASPSRGWLETSIHTWEAWRSRGVALPRTDHDGHVAESASTPPRRSPTDERAAWASVPRPIDVARVRRAVAEWHFGAGEYSVLDIIARHPFLLPATAGEVVAGDVGWVEQRCAGLVRQGLVRVVPPHELPARLRGENLLEATVRGLTLLAGSLGLSLATAVRYHGLAGGGRETPVGPRRALLTHVEHTLGADGVFAAVARAARLQRDGCLLEWRNAAACARGRVRPDGYGLLRLGRRQHGFFLEFDRGTVHLAALRAKFAAYHRYKASAAAARDYDGFPTVLAVTTGPGAEQRTVDAVRAVGAGLVSSLPVLVTTLGWMTADPAGPLGSIWLDAERAHRRSWPT